MYEIDKLSYLQIGVQGDNESTDIVIDVTAWAEKYPEAEFFIVFKPYNAQEISPMETRYEDGILTWTVNSAATAVTGVGYTEIRAQDSHGLIKKSRIIPTAVENSVSGVDDTPPAAYQEWVTAVLNAGATAKNAAAAAMAVSEGREIRFEIGTDDNPTGTSGHLLFYYMDDDDEWAYIDLGAVDAYGLAKAGGYTGTKTAFQTDMGNSGTNATSAAISAEDAEAFAIGKRNGEDVTSGDAAYHNNSKYWSGIAEAAAATASAAYGTDLLAPAYTDLTFPVKKGDHCIYSGGYYEAKQDIADSEVWTAAHWTQVTVGSDSVNIKNTSFQYRGNMDGADPTTTAVKIGSYNSRKKSNSTGYPDDMTSGHYCVIEYFILGTTARYFRIMDVSTDETWVWDNGHYAKVAFKTDLNALKAEVDESLKIGNMDTTPMEVLDGNYYPDGTSVELTSTQYRSLNSSGEVVTLSETTYNSHLCVSDPVSTSDGQCYVLNLTMAYNNGVAAFYDENDVLLKIVTGNNANSSSGNIHKFINFVVSAPTGASYFRIGYNNSHLISVKSLASYSLVSRGSKFFGKKWAFIGDSLSDPRTTRASKKYYDYIAENTGIEFTNLGVSGTGYVNDYDGAGTFISRVTNIPSDTDIVTIFGGGNDLNFRPGGSGTPVISIGTADDTTNETIMGNVYLTMQAIFTQKPDVLLGIIAPTPWDNYPPYTSGNKMLTFVTELEKLCGKYSIPFLDLYHNSNLRPWDATFRQNYYSKDNGNGVHPDENGNKRFAPMIQDFIERILNAG